MVGLSSKNGYYYPSIRVNHLKDDEVTEITNQSVEIFYDSDIYFYIDLNLTREEYINKLILNFKFVLENASDKMDFKIFKNYDGKSEKKFDDTDKGIICSPDFTVDLVDGENKISLDLTQYALKNITSNDSQLRIRARINQSLKLSCGTLDLTSDIVSGSIGELQNFIIKDKITDNLVYALNYDNQLVAINILGFAPRVLNINLDTSSTILLNRDLTFNKQILLNTKINYEVINSEKIYVYDHTNHPSIYYLVNEYVYRCFDTNSFIIDNPDEEFKIFINGEEYLIDRETKNIIQITKNNQVIKYYYNSGNILTDIQYSSIDDGVLTYKMCVYFAYNNSNITEMYYDNDSKQISIEYDTSGRISKYYVKNITYLGENEIELKVEFRYNGDKLRYIIVNDYLFYLLSYDEENGFMIQNITSIDTLDVISSVKIRPVENYMQVSDKYNNIIKYYFDSNGNNIYTVSQDVAGLIIGKQCNVNNSNNIKQPKNVFLNNLYEDVNFVRVTNSTYYTVTNKQDHDGVVNIENVYDGLNSKEYRFYSTGNSVERTIETSLAVSGKANEVLSVTALARANLNPTDYLKVQLKFKYKAKYEYEYQTYEFSFNSNDGTEQFNGMNVLSKYDYDDISLIIKYKGKQVSYISNIFVNKALIRPEIIYDENGKACGYTNENQMYISKSEFTTSPETVKNEVYNSGEQIKKSYRNGLITKEENLMTKDKVVYTYNDNNDLISKTTTIDKYTDTETYEYDENNELSMSSHNDQKTFYLNKQDLNTKINHIINPDGLFNRIVQTKKNLNEEVVQYTNQLNDLLEKHDFYYENGLLKTIKTKDLDIYKFEYDSLNRIKKIFFNDVLYIEYGYSDNDLVTTKKYSNTNIINFGYDGHNRISQVQYNNGSSTQTLATYIYDEYNRIIEIDDIDGNYHIYEYDNDNNIISEDQVDHSIQYDYNLKGELNNTRYNFNGEKHITSINSYDSTRNKFIEKISNEVYCDYLMHAGHNSLYGHINNIVSTTYDDVLKINVMELSMQNEDIIVDSLLNLNKDNGVVYNNQIFDGNTYIEKIKDCYNALAFIKVESPFTQTTPIMRFYKKTIEDENGYKNEYEYYLKILISSSNEVIIIHEKKLCDTADPSLTIGQVTILMEQNTGNYININKWNIIGFTNRPTSVMCEAIVNDSIIEVGIVKKMEYDNFRVLGNDSNPIKLVYLSCGYRIIDQNKLSMIYNEFNSIFNENKKEKISLITDYDCLDTYELDKVSLNNTFKTYKGITPNILYTKDEYANDSERFFIYDEEINKYCYLSDKNRNSFLSYGLSSNSNNFIISGYFKLFKMDVFSHNTFFAICNKQTNSELIKVTYKHPQVYLYINGSSVISKKIDFEYNKFNYFTFKKQSNSIIITVNNIKLTYNTNLSMTDINLIIGNDNNNFAFNGLFSDIIFGYPLTDIDINDYNYQNTQFISDYDSFGRVRSKQIKPKNSDNVIKTVYSYYDETDEHDKTILKQTINRIKKYDGSEEIISYDENYNIIKRVVIKDDIITNVINYEYDDFRRLKKETRHTISMSNIVTENYKASFEYDYNGNITRMIINENGDLVKDLYFTYSSDNTNRLISVYDDWEGITKTITYNNSLYPSSYNNKSITYRGNQVLKIGDVSFEYDSLGNRVLKNYDGTDTRYYYDGNKLIRQENEDGYIIDYIYTNNVLEGLKYNNEEYYFVRDITGSIEKIIDKNKTVMVVYSYTSYGEVTKNINTSLTGTQREIAQILLNNNGFVYKGYYYDVETQLYWVSSRYYSPELCRWISPDSIEYLDPESINGLNLYAYCGNDPVNRFDPTGHSWESFWNGVGDWFSDNWVKLAIGAGVVIVGAIVTAATCGTGLGFFAAFGGALLTSAKAVAISTAISAGIGLAVGGITTGSWEGALDGMLDGIADGFMWGGIFAGGAQILSGAFKAYAQVANHYKKLAAVKKSPFFSPDRLKSATEIAKIAKKGQSFYDYGGTIVRFGRFAHIDASTKSLLHLATFGFNHIPIGTIAAGFIGGF